MGPKSRKNTTNTSVTEGSSQQQSKPRVGGYKLNDLIGKGTYGQVYRAVKTDNQELVAIKCVPLKSLGKNSRDNIVTEISILKKLKHDFIVQMLDFQWDKAFVYMIFEFCTGGELASIIRLKRSFPEDMVQHFLQQLTSAMKYLRDNNVAHLDLKPQNILITGIQFVALLNGLNSFNTWRQVILKIADFGFAQYLSNDESSNSLRGSPLYMAPEIIKRQEYDARADLWSMGIILYECLFGKTPLHGMSTAEITQGFIMNTIKIIIPQNKLSQLCFDLLKGLLKIDPNLRISFSNFFAHPFIDLEHMPTKESFSKATQILKMAADYEAQGNLKSAFYNFREALLYLMPLYRWGLPQQPIVPKKQEQLKALIVRNMEKAEELKQKCGLANVDQTMVEDVQKIYNQIDRARDLASKDLHLESLEKYEKALEKSMNLIRCYGQKIRQEFFGDINEWMSEAEAVKEKYTEEKKAIQKELDKSRQMVEEKMIVAEKVNQTFGSGPSPKANWYSKLKEPLKSNKNGHSKLKHFDSGNISEDIIKEHKRFDDHKDDHDDDDPNDHQPICFVQ